LLLCSKIAERPSPIDRPYLRICLCPGIGGRSLITIIDGRDDRLSWLLSAECIEGQ
jgi:hypothetical protein